LTDLRRRRIAPSQLIFSLSNKAHVFLQLAEVTIILELHKLGAPGLLGCLKCLVDVCDMPTLKLPYFSRHLICFWKLPVLRKAK